MTAYPFLRLQTFKESRKVRGGERGFGEFAAGNAATTPGSSSHRLVGSQKNLRHVPPWEGENKKKECAPVPITSLGGSRRVFVPFERRTSAFAGGGKLEENVVKASGPEKTGKGGKGRAARKWGRCMSQRRVCDLLEACSPQSCRRRGKDARRRERLLKRALVH